MCKECYQKYFDNREDSEKCPFCNIENKFKKIFFDMEGVEQDCDAWIDYELADPDEFSWYAILSGAQFTRGHTLVILGCHMDQMTEKISDSDKKKANLQSMMMGINKLSNLLKEKLRDVEAVHSLCLCEGERTHHLHFHLIPRYKYNKDEKRFYGYFYGQRAIKWNNKIHFENEFEKGIIHGMWYDAYQELHFLDNEFNSKILVQRKKELEELAESLRTKPLPKKFA